MSKGAMRTDENEQSVSSPTGSKHLGFTLYDRLLQKLQWGENDQAKPFWHQKVLLKLKDDRILNKDVLLEQ